MEIRKTEDMVAEAKSHIENLSVAEVQAEIRDGTAVVVDIRDIRERILQGAIPGSMHAARGMLEFWVDPSSEYHRKAFSPENRYILYCAGGLRSALAADTMRSMGYANVAHLDAGFSGWEAAGAEIENVAETAKWVRRDS